MASNITLLDLFEVIGNAVRSRGSSAPKVDKPTRGSAVKVDTGLGDRRADLRNRQLVAGTSLSNASLEAVAGASLPPARRPSLQRRPGG